MTEAEIYAALDEIFRDVFLRDDIALTPELSAKDVAGWDSFRQIDIILAIDGATVTAADDLVRNLTADKIGCSLTLAVLRSGERRTVSLIAEERPRKERS